MMSIAPDIEEIELKSKAFEYLMTEDDIRDRAEDALERAMFVKVRSLPT